MSLVFRIFCFALPFALFLPFDPQWPDFERARRGILMLVVGAFVLAGGIRRAHRESVFVPLALLAVFGLASSLWAHDPWAALEAGAYACALATLPWLVPAAGSEPAARARRGLADAVALALLAVTVYGLLQGLGLSWPRDYTVPHEPVSTFGNRNVAAEACAAATPLALAGSPVLGVPAIIAAAAYLGLNGGRAGMLAFGLVLLTIFFLRWRLGRIARPWHVLELTVVGLVVSAALGILARTDAPQPVPDETAPVVTAPVETAPEGDVARVGDTIEVRRLLYASTLALAKDALPLGVGAGNYRVQFPRFRDAREIEISSRGHRFGTRVVVAHNDPLQVFAEFGIAGLLILLAGCWLVVAAIAKGRLASTGIAVLVAWVPLTLLRAPAFNAAASAIAVVTLASCLRNDPRARTLSQLTSTGLRALGIPLCLLGASILYGEFQGADFFRAKLQSDPQRGVAALDRAIAYDPLETDWSLLRAQIHHKLGSPVPAAHLEGTLTDLHSVLARRPFEYKALIDLGFLGLVHAQQKVGTRTLADVGREATATLLELDPNHPQALFLASEYSFVAGDEKRAIEHLRNLRDSAAILQKQAQIRELQRQTADEATKIRLMRIRLALGRLHAELFPK